MYLEHIKFPILKRNQSFLACPKKRLNQQMKRKATDEEKETQITKCLKEVKKAKAVSFQFMSAYGSYHTILSHMTL